MSIMIPEFDISRGVKLFQNLRCFGNKHVFNVVGSWMSEKYDGVRAIYLGSEKLITCRGLRIEAPKSFFVGFPDGYVLDGELWISHNNFNTISGLVRKSSQASPIWDSVKFLVFDIIHSYDSRFDVTQMTFEQRQELLSSLIPSYEITTTPSPQSNEVMGECTYPPIYGVTSSDALSVYEDGGFEGAPPPPGASPGAPLRGSYGGGGALPGASLRGGYGGGGAPPGAPPPPGTVGCGESFSL